MPKPDLRLEDKYDYEETDIGDLDIQTGLTLLSTTTSTFASSAGISPEPTASRPSISVAFNDRPLQLHRKSSLGHLVSPSSPDLVKVNRPRTLSRSQTLPRVPQLDGKTRRKQFGFEGIDVEPAVVTNIRKWILGIAVVNFDLDDGPVVSGVLPPLILYPTEAENLAFSSFPDSLQFDQGSQIHSFRIREEAISIPSEKRPASIDGFIYGFSHFTQRRDSTSKRGYEQRSLVILTHHQYPALFSSVSSIIGPLYQSHGFPMLEAACHNIATWSDPAPGATLELGFLGSVIHVELPHTIDEQQLSDTSSFKEKYDPRLHILASSPPFLPPPLLLFEASLSHLWSIWECVVLGEPILIFGSSPAQTSQAVWWFRDLLRPIPSVGDFRPYFTIHDRDHALLVNKLPPKSGVLLGVTNPFFERSCAHWPHILSLGGKTPPPKSALKSSSSAASAGPSPGWKTKIHKRYISKDRPLLKQLETACRGTEQERLAISMTLRRHFCSRTAELLIPLSRYLQTLIPTPTEVGTARASNKDKNLRLKPFSSVNFFASLKADGSPLPFRSTSKRTEFYERWMKTPAFGLWLAQQESIVQGVLKENLERQP